MENLELTKENVQNLKGEPGTLSEYVADYVLDRWDEYERKERIFLDVLKHGCVSGIVSSLVYYDDTKAFFDKHKEEINEMLAETMSECGTYSPQEIFGSKWAEEDPLCLDWYNKNLLAWFAFEETLRKIAREFDIE